MAFAVNCMELAKVNDVLTGCILLCGMFLYDIFWVFDTDVMVTVAKSVVVPMASSVEAPIVLVFPVDILQNGLSAGHFAGLGLGDIVLPGLFIALILRYDVSLKRQSYFYFKATLLAYLGGLLLTFFIMRVFQHGQPALLYLAPVCISTPLTAAWIRGDIKSMLKYEEESEKACKSPSEVSIDHQLLVVCVTYCFRSGP